MILKKIISFIAKICFRKDYLILKTKIDTTYKTILRNESITNTEILERLLISGEDHRFRYHLGFDIIAIFRAIKNKIFFNRKEGASTIEQQTVRVLINRFEKTLHRKIKEIFLATTLSEIVPRKAIPKIYLHIAYYGTNLNGLNQVYKQLQVDQSHLTNELAAEIIARIKYPEPISLNEKRARQIQLRKNHLLILYNKHLTRKWIKVYG